MVEKRVKTSATRNSVKVQTLSRNTEEKMYGHRVSVDFIQLFTPNILVKPLKNKKQAVVVVHL